MKPQFLTLQKRNREGSITINVNRIIYMDAAVGGEGTLITFDTNNYHFVKECVEDIVARIQGD